MQQQVSNLQQRQGALLQPSVESAGWSIRHTTPKNASSSLQADGPCFTRRVRASCRARAQLQVSSAAGCAPCFRSRASQCLKPWTAQAQRQVGVPVVAMPRCQAYHCSSFAARIHHGRQNCCPVRNPERAI